MEVTVVEIQEEIDLAISVAGRLWVPCQDKTGVHEERYTYCDTCSGTSKVWPLRKPCLCGCHIEVESHEVHKCLECQGRGWTPNTDYDALRAALRAKGWNLTIETEDPDGDWIQVCNGNGDEIGRVSPLLGLRDTVALLTAISLTLDAEEQR